MNKKRKLGDLQLAIMRVLWERGEAAASEVHKALLEERGLAVTTVKTMLRKLEEYGCVDHRANGRQFIYRPCVAEIDAHGDRALCRLRRAHNERDRRASCSRRAAGHHRRTRQRRSRHSRAERCGEWSAHRRGSHDRNPVHARQAPLAGTSQPVIFL